MADTFPGVIAFAFAVSMILVGSVLRARVGLLQRGLVPASLIGGVVGFTLINLDLSLGFEAGDFTSFTFHFFTLSFMSLCLTGSEHRSGSIVKGGTWLSVVWVMSLVLQALVGLGVILAYNSLSATELSPFLGLIVTHGFTQGPGQALALGAIWEDQLGVEHAVNFGLIYASAGFVVAFAVGVPIARWAIKRGLNQNTNASLTSDFVRGIYPRDAMVPSGNQVTNPANVDTLAFHLGILGLAYVITDQYLGIMQPVMSQVDLGAINLGIIFSHNLFFLHGLIVCLIIRAIMDRTGLGHLIDNETQRRITGSAVDLMVVCTIMSIQFALLLTYLVPILLVCIAVTAVTAVLCFGLGRRLSSLGVERALTAFGCCCGSTGSGLLLLRILDPDLSTPIARELAFFNIAILFLGFHVLTLMAPGLPAFSLTTIALVYVATLTAGAILALLLTRTVAAKPDQRTDT